MRLGESVIVEGDVIHCLGNGSHFSRSIKKATRHEDANDISRYIKIYENR